MDKVDEAIAAEMNQLNNLERIGLTTVQAIEAYSLGVDYHDIENFLKQQPNCPPHLALEIVR